MPTTTFSLVPCKQQFLASIILFCAFFFFFFYLNELGSHKYWIDKIDILTWETNRAIIIGN